MHNLSNMGGGCGGGLGVSQFKGTGKISVYKSVKLYKSVLTFLLTLCMLYMVYQSVHVSVHGADFF